MLRNTDVQNLSVGSVGHRQPRVDAHDSIVINLASDGTVSSVKIDQAFSGKYSNIAAKSCKVRRLLLGGSLTTDKDSIAVCKCEGQAHGTPITNEKSSLRSSAVHVDPPMTSAMIPLWTREIDSRTLPSACSNAHLPRV